MTSTEWAAWSAVLAAFLSIVASLVVVYLQNKKQWLLHSASMVTTLLEEFESEHFEVKRRRCAELAARHLSGKHATLLKHYGFGVPGFFEHVGHLVRRRALDEEMVWNRLGWEIAGYYEALSAPPSLIAELRENHPSIFTEFEWLHRKMFAHFSKHGDMVYDSNHQLVWMKEFLDQELLGGPGAHARAQGRVDSQCAPNQGGPADG